MAPRIQARDIRAQGLNIKYEFTKDISDLFTNTPPEIDEYADKINDIMQNTTENLYLIPETEPFRKLVEQCLYKISKRQHPMYTSTRSEAPQPSSSQESKTPKQIMEDGFARSEWQILPDFFSEVSRCLNQLNPKIGYRVHRTHRKGFRVPIGSLAFQRTDCGQYVEVINGGILKPYTRWPIKAAFYTTHLGPDSAEDYLAGEILSLITQVAFNFENDPQSVEGDQECYCATMHGQYVHFSTTIIPDKYIKYHNTGKSFKELDEVKVLFSPEYNITKAEDRLSIIWGFVALYMHLNPSRRKQSIVREFPSSIVPVEEARAVLAQKIKDWGIRRANEGSS
ncbi:hypothetical protein H072_7106 [Dactylellina haptotyla CBS 200.50]|uniref:Uncharacterized protein n=1 Tax=Dactylellina haptotyla (strain CBS 200.50) TaxID=1284197 RepID=S8ADD3_DACHA|nr:hypothetical protein H072_7106 [Dactylellina haptotyla CBS 200.50]